MVVQAAASRQEDAGAIHVGYTASKKTGNAIARNRIKRRMRAAAKDIIAQQGRTGVDYVLIGRRFCVQSAYDALCKDLEKAINHLNRQV